MHLKGLVVLLQKMVCFTGVWATILEVLALELQAFCQFFAESAFFLIFYLISNLNNTRKKSEK